jgi:peptide-methionine (S)-S-oxide reductase
MTPRISRLPIILLALLVPSLSCAQDRSVMPRPDQLLPGRTAPMALPRKHLVFGTPLDIAPPGAEVAVFSMGCFWGAEQHFFHVPGVISTAVGYAGGTTPNPTYDEVSTGRTGHAESVRVVFDPKKISYEALLRLFWEGHDPTQGMRQGNDLGTEYRSQIVALSDAQQRAAEATRDAYAAALRAAGRAKITTEIVRARPFYFAEADHQQYCEANPQGYCNHDGTGVRFPAVAAAQR